MKLTISRATLVSALARAQGIVERRTVNPALAHVHLQTTPAGLRMTATDTLTTLVCDYDATVEQPGAVTVDAATFFQVAKALSGGTVLLSTASNRLKVACGNVEHGLLAGSPDDYPPTPKIKPGGAATLKAPDLRRLINETIFAVSEDDKRYGLNGIHAETVTHTDGADRLRFVTTDGNRLSYSEAPFTGAISIPRAMLLPRKALGEVRKLADTDDAEWSLSIGDRAATFRSGPLTLHTRLVEGEFPDYRQVLPSSFSRRAEIKSPAFSVAAQNVRVMANDKNHLVRFAFDDTRLLLSADNVDAGNARGEVALDYTGGPLTTGFNLTFFQDILNATGAPAFSLDLGAELDPCIVRINDRDDCLFVVMPMRLE